MPLLHMETELVRGAGNQLKQVLASVEFQVQQLHHSVQNLSGAWQGPSANIFVGEVQPLLQQLTQFVSIGDLLNQRLKREVEEWEIVGRYFGGLSNELGADNAPITMTPGATETNVPPDQTEWFLSEMFRNLYITQKTSLGSEGSVLEQASKLLTFFESVKTGGDWDYKNGDLKDFATTGVILSGETYANDVPGNIMYGFMGASLAEEIKNLTIGLEAETVLLGLAGYVQVNPGASKADIAELLLNPDRIRLLTYSQFLDDPLDQNAIRVGFELYRQGPSPENFDALLKSTELRTP